MKCHTVWLGRTKMAMEEKEIYTEETETLKKNSFDSQFPASQSQLKHSERWVERDLNEWSILLHSFVPLLILWVYWLTLVVKVSKGTSEMEKREKRVTNGSCVVHWCLDPEMHLFCLGRRRKRELEKEKEREWEREGERGRTDLHTIHHRVEPPLHLPSSSEFWRERRRKEGEEVKRKNLSCVAITDHEWKKEWLPVLLRSFSFLFSLLLSLSVSLIRLLVVAASIASTASVTLVLVK